MSDPWNDLETILAELEPLSPSDALRDLVLERAGAALGRPIALDRWTQIYASRPLRAAWAAAVLGLMVANMTLPTAKLRWREGRFVAGTAEQIEELRAVVALPRLREGYVLVDAFAYRRPVVAMPAFPGTRRKEKTS